MKRKADQKLRAIELRKRGHSLNEIVAFLNVAKSSASVWVRNVPLSARALTILATKIGNGRLKGAETRRRISADGWQQARRQSDALVQVVPSDPAFNHIVCALLYYCEGAKGTTGGVRFTNSNPALMARFIDLFRKCYIIDERRMRIGLHLHEYHDADVQRSYWSKATGGPIQQFIRPYRKPHTGKRWREGTPGCATFHYSSTEMAPKFISVAERYFVGA